MPTFEEVQSSLDETLQYLKKCDDYTTTEVNDVLLAFQFNLFKSDQDDRYKKVSYLVSQGFGELFGRMWNALNGFLEKDKWQQDGFSNLEAILLIFFYCTNHWPDIGADLGKHGGISMLLAGLQKLEIYFEDNEEIGAIEGLVGSILNILFNSIVYCSTNIKIYRDADALVIFKKYLKSRNQRVNLQSLLILAYIVDESESGLLATADGAVALLLDWLQRAVSSSDHDLDTIVAVFSARELLDCLNHLAINDDNKLEIEKEGGIPIIVRMLQDDFDTEEQIVAAETVWNLAFEKSIRKSSQLQEAVPLLDKLRKSSNRNLRKTSSIAFWEINDNRPEDLPARESTPEDAPPSYEESIQEPKKAASNTAKLMISYQWDSQPIAVNIRDKLVQDGYSVWMDLTHMRDDILTSMAEAVEKSEVILMFMSEPYKNSQSCRTEAQYAYKKKKKIIPLIVQEGYDPDGWLGALLGTRLYYKFFTDEDFTKTDMSLLLTSLKESTQATKGSDEHDGPIKATQAPNVRAAAAPSSKSKSHVSNWTEEDVQEWLKKEKLDDLCDKLDDLNGSHLERMYSDYCEDPKEFKQEMKSEDYQITGKKYLKFTVALQNLLQK